MLKITSMSKMHVTGLTRFEQTSRYPGMRGSIPSHGTLGNVSETSSLARPKPCEEIWVARAVEFTWTKMISEKIIVKNINPKSLNR